MEIRRYEPEEADEIWRLYYNTTRIVNGRAYTQAQVERWAPDEFDQVAWRKRLARSNPFVVVKAGKILAFAELLPDGLIDDFYGHHEHQREGVGTKLYRVVEEEARRMGLEALHAHVSLNAKPFFLRMGFEVVKEQRNIVCGEEAPNTVMRKVLPTAR